MEKLRSIIVLFVLLVCFFACRQKQELSVREIPYKFNYQIEQELALDSMDWKYQISATEYSLKGDHINALIHWDSAMGMREPVFDSRVVDKILSDYSPKDAKKYILSVAKDYRVIIINEAHHNSRHRVFTESLLTGLYNQGFTSLGLEALAHGETSDSLLNYRNYPIISSGHYIKEPCFASMLRAAASLGFSLFSYEAITQGANGRVRELEQARNITDYMINHPNEKILIHCGYDHVFEGEHSSWGKTMAANLEEYTGLEVLSIDQTEYSPRSKPEYDHPIIPVDSILYPVVYIDSTGMALGRKKGYAYTDISVIHPRIHSKGNRSDFLEFDKRKEMKYEYRKASSLNYPLMILAYNANEHLDTAIPVDIQELASAQEDAYLVLAPGAYTLLHIDDQGRSYTSDIRCDENYNIDFIEN